MQSGEPIDLLTGDWMSEGNMTTAALRKLNKTDPNTHGFEKSFLDTIAPVLHRLAEQNIKVAVNAGACDTKLLCCKVEELVQMRGLSLKVAWISGDEVLGTIQTKHQAGEECLINLKSGQNVQNLPGKPLFAQAYLGARGVTEALKNGADIVICGRVADASPIIGGAMWWHDWTESQHQELACAFVAGHLVECSTYITGGNFSGFKSIPSKEDLGFPIVEIGAAGEVIVTKVASTGGAVTKDTVTAQLLYEIQGPWYFHSDVVACLDQIHVQEVGKDRVKVEGVSGLPPPPTTKVGITLPGGYQAELHWSLVGLDIQAKAALLEHNIRTNLGERASQFSRLQFSTNGVPAEDGDSQSDCTVDFRIFVQAPEAQTLSVSNWIEPVLDVIMCSYPGATPHPATTTGLPRQYCEYQPYLIPQSLIKHQVHLGLQTLDIPTPTHTKCYPFNQPSHDPRNPIDLKSFGPTTRGPIGWVAHARSGDKGSDANVGFWVKTAEQYSWLRSLLTISFLKQLLGRDYKEGCAVDRFELPGLLAVHFLMHNYLDRGVNIREGYRNS
ncbi:hypothetical protein EDB81DRAFT_846240 [Dactylonectria macrodidyma]|uniref:DUF1446-domain-containing protein n=1 Tax=Dactylonectria macrodidyma TaxID=307937 RepID=A0A9P9DYI2_9HYPO|nr:hypothetical protein EDB81DRAFT_846240 [Dactylonectria macrodidyma]